MSWEPQRNKPEAVLFSPKVAPNFLSCNLFWYALMVHKSRAALHQSLTLPIGSKPHRSFACNCHEPGPCMSQGFSDVWYGVTLQPGTDASPLLATTSQDLAKLTRGMSPSDLLQQGIGPQWGLPDEIAIQIAPAFTSSTVAGDQTPLQCC